MTLPVVHGLRREYDQAAGDEDRQQKVVQRLASTLLVPEHRAIQEELVSLIGEDNFWDSHPTELARAAEMLINTDGRHSDERIGDLIQRQKCFDEPVRFTLELAAAIETDDPFIGEEMRSFSGSSEKLEFWRGRWQSYVIEKASMFESVDILKTRPSLLRDMVKQRTRSDSLITKSAI